MGECSICERDARIGHAEDCPFAGGKSYREDGWYWVRKKDWNDHYGDWVPALWQTEFRSWRSAHFSGIPDHEMIVGERLVAPDKAHLLES